ncbi:hypothetical protein CN884_04985 [Ochrobactrum sp. 30A/1000/2015]|uniref:Uncharacterized protein n=4 Tax=Brucella intermedia TaxID=94625 RepID=C4WQR4_9HYPH|nr:Hypothetical protein OINT_2001810 [Brucella intermedia LMG 3301]OAE37082.1 hypothetical protein A7J42_21910 [Brucella intermedia]OOC51035.1 hypothetical protein AS855_05675 [Brucella intermedia M86]PJT27733.1 hypothetical protein CN884_04985 [Ochrobactrum sp. 30A/1000/2015]PJT40560.1 hypothetical protein CN883_03505 [Ochrobactrum sp. 27A/999/2015]PJT42804.1 hypothetical protein CN882_12550 [Ochrobactrum sp. 23A/997/2015]
MCKSYGCQNYCVVRLKLTAFLRTVAAGIGRSITMKSLGKRLIAGLKSWRSRKKPALPDEMPDAGPAASESPEQPEPILPTRLSIKVTTKDPDEESDKAIRQVELAPLQEVLSFAEEPKVPQEAPVVVEPERKEEGIDETVTLPPIRKSPQKRLRAKRPSSKTEDGPVTDEELEELEAENARLKLLLNERLKAKQDGSEN